MNSWCVTSEFSIVFILFIYPLLVSLKLNCRVLIFGLGLHCKSPDSHILDCTIYFKRILEASGGGIMLMTNDKALSLEAELEGDSSTLSSQTRIFCSFDDWAL